MRGWYEREFLAQECKMVALIGDGMMVGDVMDNWVQYTRAVVALV